jgi:hypothetical protein
MVVAGMLCSEDLNKLRVMEAEGLV